MHILLGTEIKLGCAQRRGGGTPGLGGAGIEERNEEAPLKLLLSQLARGRWQCVRGAGQGHEVLWACQTVAAGAQGLSVLQLRGGR